MWNHKERISNYVWIIIILHSLIDGKFCKRSGLMPNIQQAQSNTYQYWVLRPIRKQLKHGIKSTVVVHLHSQFIQNHFYGKAHQWPALLFYVTLLLHFVLAIGTFKLNRQYISVSAEWDACLQRDYIPQQSALRYAPMMLQATSSGLWLGRPRKGGESPSFWEPRFFAVALSWLSN